jgi:hypothetical protein
MKDIPAFPCTHPDFATFGMTLRDYFAAKALPAVYTEYVRRAAAFGWDGDWQDAIAQDAYKMADAMLAERKMK